MINTVIIVIFAIVIIGVNTIVWTQIVSTFEYPSVLSQATGGDATSEIISHEAEDAVDGSGETYWQNMDDKVDIGNIRLMFPVLSDDPNDDIGILQPYLKSGDILTDGVLQQDIMLAVGGGVEVAVGGVSVNDTKTIVVLADSDVTWITYDYEPAFTPAEEYSYNMTVANTYFKDLYNTAHSRNYKLVIVPVYVYGLEPYAPEEWDWGEVAKNTDMIVLQVQNYQTGHTLFPEEFRPSALGHNMKDAVKKVVEQINAKSPDTLLFLQLDSIPDNANPDYRYVLSDILMVKDLGIDGLTLWFPPNMSSDPETKASFLDVVSRLERD